MKKILRFFLAVFLLGTLPLNADLLETFGFQKAEIDVVIGDKKSETVRRIKTEIEDRKSQETKEQEDLQGKAGRIKAKVDEIEQMLANGGIDTFAQQKLVNLQNTYQILAELRNVKKNVVETLKQHVTLIEEPSNVESTEQMNTEKTVYLFEDLQDLNRKITSQDDKCAHLEAERNEVSVDLENSRKRVDVTKKIYDQKVREQADIRKKFYTHSENINSQQVDAADIEMQLAENEYLLAQAKVDERTIKLRYLNEAVNIENKKLTKLKKKRDFIVVRALRIDKSDIDTAQRKLNKHKQQHLAVVDRYLQKIDYLGTQQETLRQDLSKLDQAYADVSGESPSLDEWTSSPTSAKGYLAFVDRGTKKAESHLLEGQIEFQRVAIELEKVKFKEHELNLQVVQSWFNIKHQKFSNNRLLKAISDYQDFAADCSRERSMYDDKRYAVINRLNLQNRSLSNIKVKMEELSGKSRFLFRKDEQGYMHCVEQLEVAQLLLMRQIEITGHLIEMYSNIVVMLSGYEKQAISAISELQRASLWQRSGGAISFSGLQNMIPDLISFSTDVFNLGTQYIGQFTGPFIMQRLDEALQHPLSICFAFLKLLFFCCLYLLFAQYALGLSSLLLSIEPEYKGVYFFSRLAAASLQFLHARQAGIFIWSILFWYVAIDPSFDVYPTVVFYLLSIPYFLYLTRQCVSFVLDFNRKNNYELFPETFEGRLVFSIGTFLYASVIILFFREAFIAATYMKSELPGIFLAFYSIIVRMLFLSLIRKEDLLSVIPARTLFGAWICRVVDEYYYGILAGVIGVMVLSDPHIGGYDNLVTYLCWGVAGTVIAARVLFLLYTFVRRTSSLFFFSYADETVQERFQYAKTWYGVWAILLFVFFFFVGIILVAWCWGKTISLHSFVDFFSIERLSIGLKDGKYQRVSIFDLLRTFLYLPGSFLVAHLVDKFILHRIYMVLLVDSGVHNAVSTISYYVIVISVITLGLCYEGFGFLVSYYILPLMVSMAWAIRDVFNDFVAYFILLVQRPLKVGDYIKINDEVKGVVRKITPRTVVLRREQSYHLIIPNSKFMQDIIFNWDYTRSFIAFPDIIVCVHFSNDPENIKKLLLQAVDSVLNVLKIPPPVIRLEAFSDSGFVFMIRGFISSEMTLEQWNIASDVRLAIVKTLTQNQIEFSYPLRIVRNIVHPPTGDER